ncbi:MAG: hypothetical protein R3E04_06915 [Sphingobium sp.]
MTGALRHECRGTLSIPFNDLHTGAALTDCTRAIVEMGGSTSDARFLSALRDSYTAIVRKALIAA